MVVGVLAFQGDFSEHIDVLSRMHVPSVEVRTKPDLAKIDALIIPGGESTVIARFLSETGVGSEIQKRMKNHAHSLIIYGTCAGAILLARRATGKNAPKTLGLLDASLERNAYGTQANSFEADLKISGIQKPVSVSFIRAPKITHVGKHVEVLSRFRGEPVLLKQGNVMIGTFHPEMRHSLEVHKLFLNMLP